MAFKGIAVLYPCRNAMTPEERNFIKITPADAATQGYERRTETHPIS